MLTIAVLGTLDTKGNEHAFVADRIRDAGHRALLIDVGTAALPNIKPNITREEVLAFPAPLAPSSPAHLPRGTGGERSQISFAEQLPTDRGQAIAEMVNAVPHLLRQLVDQGKIHGIISLGGTGGTAIGTAAMRALPMGFPKVMVSTVAGGNVSQYVDVSDIVMFPSIVDVSGLNRISQGVFARAAAAVCSMAETNAKLHSQPDSKPLIVASMFGNTTRCVEHARKLLESAGYEVLVFHATGIGGRSMEAIIASGVVAGVLDITTTEWADELVGGVMRGGPHRLEAAARGGVPAVVAPGCLDMVNFAERNSMPEVFRDRTLYQHNPQITLMRTTSDECRQLGRIIASKLNQSIGPVRVLFPMRAISVISAAGQPFHDPIADQALCISLRESLRPDIPFDEVDCEINDPVFAERCVKQLLAIIANPMVTHAPALD